MGRGRIVGSPYRNDRKMGVALDAALASLKDLYDVLETELLVAHTNGREDDLVSIAWRYGQVAAMVTSLELERDMLGSEPEREA